MKYLIYSFLSLALVNFTPLSFAADHLQSVRATKKFSENVVSLVKDNATERAFNLLKPHWPLAPTEVDDLMAHTKAGRQNILERFGKSLHVEYVRTEKIGDSLVRHIFIEKFERHALRWQLSFYKPDEVWLVNSVYWDDKVSDLYAS